MTPRVRNPPVSPSSPLALEELVLKDPAHITIHNMNQCQTMRLGET